MRAQATILGFALAAGSLFAACGSDDTPSVSEAKADFCSAVAEVAQDRVALGELNATSSVDDAQTAVANLKDAMSAAKSAAEEVGQAEVDALRSAYDELQSTIDGIDDSDTIAEAAPDVVKARDTFAAQWDAIQSKNCGGAAASPTTTTS